VQVGAGTEDAGFVVCAVEGVEGELGWVGGFVQEGFERKRVLTMSYQPGIRMPMF